MAPSTFRGLDRRFRTVVVLIVASFFSTLTYALLHAEQSAATSLPNNFPQRNPGGYGATFSSQGEVDLTGEYFQPQGSNGRSCATCHLPEEAWAITPGTLQRLFDHTGGMHPIFNRLDSNNEALPVGSLAERLAAYSMLLSRGVFRRGGTPRAGSEWELIAVDDPHAFANLNRLVHWRRVMPTINFALGSATVNWDGGNSVGSDQHAGLINQATRNVVGAQQGPAAPPEVLADIVAFEESLFTGQLIVLGVGRLDDDGARGGPEALSTMTRRPGRFDLFDAWLASENPRRAQIARGQELFNTRGCGSCHDSANNGTNTSNRLFDIGTASAAVRNPRSSAIYVPPPNDAGDPPTHRRGPRQHHRFVGRPRQVQDADAARSRCPSPVLPQRYRPHAGKRRALLRRSPRVRFQRCGTCRPRGVSERAVGPVYRSKRRSGMNHAAATPA